MTMRDNAATAQLCAERGQEIERLKARVASLEAQTKLDDRWAKLDKPHGWLTPSDRQNLEEIAVCLDDDNWPDAAAFVRSLLARYVPGCD